jgi:hypothetical protein
MTQISAIDKLDCVCNCMNTRVCEAVRVWEVFVNCNSLSNGNEAQVNSADVELGSARRDHIEETCEMFALAKTTILLLYLWQTSYIICL